MNFITLERYTKICHAIWHRKYFRRWMLKVGVVLTWLDGICVYLIPAWSTINMVNGSCLVFQWQTKPLQRGYSVSVLLFQTVMPLIVSGVCYWKIFGVIRRQGHVVAPAANATSAGQNVQVTKTQKNVVKTTIYVTACFGICWLPIQV
jgi:hypothetical protein